MACGFSTPHGLKIYLGVDYFANFTFENNNLNESESFSVLTKILRRIECLYELPRCLSVYLLAVFLFCKFDFSFGFNCLLFLGVKFFGCLISRIHLPKSLYSILCFIAFPFQLISFNFYLPYIAIIAYAYFTHQVWILLSYLVAFLIFYTIDMILSVPFVLWYTKNKYGIGFLGTELASFNVFYNELSAYSFMSYGKFINEYCEWMNYEPVTYA